MACPPLPHHVMSAYKIEYASTGKGGSEYIHIENRKLLYIKNQQDTIARKLRKRHYNELYRLFLKTPLDSLEYLSVPSKRHQIDAALATTFTVTNINSKQEYHSPTFDDDNPPEEVKELLEYVKELASKQ
jgi:hypothetical protein